jgi:hypothetical protein
MMNRVIIYGTRRKATTTESVSVAVLDLKRLWEVVFDSLHLIRSFICNCFERHLLWFLDIIDIRTWGFKGSLEGF